jgi:hypothetical protein
MYCVSLFYNTYPYKYPRITFYSILVSDESLHICEGTFLQSISEIRMMHFLLGIGFLQEGAPELLRILAVCEDGDPVSTSTTNSQLFFKCKRSLTRKQCCGSGHF